MEQKLEALLGIHDPFLNRSLSRFLKRSYTVTSVTTLEEMRLQLGVNGKDSTPINGEDLLSTCRYSVVIMDVNLGYPNTGNIAAGRGVYHLLRPLIEERQINFTTVSGNDRVVEMALAEGIHCVTKPDGIIAYIQMLQQ